MSTPAPNDSSIQRGLIPEDLLQFSWADELALDPGGERLAFTVRRPRADSNDYTVDLYCSNADGSDVRRLNDTPGRAFAVAWSPDGRRLAYTWVSGHGAELPASPKVELPASSNAEGTMPLPGRPLLRVCAFDGSAVRSYGLDGAPMTGLAWSPDGRRLAGVRWTHYRHPDDRGARPGVPQPTVKVIRRLRYKQDGVGFVHDRYTQIWLLDLDSGDLTQVTGGECDYAEPAWSARGDRLAFLGLAREQNNELGQGQIFVCDVPGGTPRRLLPDWVGACRSPQWGDDDSSIAFAGHIHPAPTNRRIFMQPFLADVAAATARPLAEQLDQEVGNYAVADQRAGLSNITLKWPAGDRWIYFLLTEQGATHLYRVDTAGITERIVDGPCVVFEYSPAAGNVVAFGRADPANPGDIWIWRGGQAQRVTTLNAWLGDYRLAEPQEYWYDGLDGARVHAWLMTPPGMDRSRRHPLVLQVHCSMFSWDFCHEFQCLAGAGFVVAYFNQRGTTAGYGQAWTRASEGDQGGRDFEEIMLGVDQLLEQPFIDAARMGVTGGSCGGFLTNWIVGHTDRFAAAVTQRSITNQVSFFGTADIGPECTIWETHSTPWEDLEANWRQSPIAYAGKVTTPLLILHSDEDHRCPLEQAEQLFAILRWLNREVELVVFEGENHGLSRGGRPGNRIERLRRIQGWFERYLGTHPGAAVDAKEHA